MPGPELDDVQVDLEDSPLREMPLEPPREQRLLEFARRVAGRREPQVLRQLLADGRGSARQFTRLHRLADRGTHLGVRKSVVGEELDVLRHEHRPLGFARDPVVGDPGPGERRLGRPRRSERAERARRALLVAVDEGGGLRIRLRQHRDVGPGDDLEDRPPGNRHDHSDQRRGDSQQDLPVAVHG